VEVGIGFGMISRLRDFIDFGLLNLLWDVSPLSENLLYVV
jgi:hypothetical protein